MSNTVKIVIAILAFVSLNLGLFLTTDSDESPLARLTKTTTTEEPRSRSWNETEKRELNTDAVLAFNDAIVEITENTNPSVVTITTSQMVRQRMRSPLSFFFGDPRFDEEREFMRQGLGSGVIISEDGYILTNNHVIAEADEIVVQTFDGEELEAELIGTDPGTDVAVLRVNSNDLRAIPLGDSDELRVGELVLAIGSPLRAEFANTVSMGVVSAKGRADLGLSAYENYIQTDAAINPGNSGGALINMQGELIGINTAIASRTGGFQGIGFAIPMNLARDVMESIIDEGRVVRSYIGIYQGAMVDQMMAQALGLDVNYGVVVGEVVPDGPADKAGLEEGDVLLSLNGRPIRNWDQFRFAIASTDPGTEVEFEVFRDDERQTVTLVLEEQPVEEELAEAVPEDSRNELREELGFGVMNLNDSIRRQLNLNPGVEGVIVSEVDQGGRAQRQGLQRSDIIFQVQNQPVTSEDEFYSTISSLKSAGQEVVLLRVLRNGTRNVFIALQL